MTVGKLYSEVVSKVILLSITMIIIGIVTAFLKFQISESLIMLGIIVLMFSPFVGILFLALYYARRKMLDVVPATIVIVIMVLNILSVLLGS